VTIPHSFWHSRQEEGPLEATRTWEYGELLLAMVPSMPPVELLAIQNDTINCYFLCFPVQRCVRGMRELESRTPLAPKGAPDKLDDQSARNHTPEKK